jgi:hypothetical protein
MKREHLFAVLAVVACILGSSVARASLVTPQALGDTTAEKVYGNATNPKLTSILTGYGILRPDNTPINVGDISAGQNPSTSDQLQWQRFAVTEASTIVEMQFFGGEAAYKNIVGLFTAPISSPASLTLVPAFIGNVTAVGATFNYTVPQDHLFGFYIDANGLVSSDGMYFSQNSLNSDNTYGKVHDHFLMFQSNQGLAVAVEDLPYSKSTCKLGDQDYNDIVFTVKHRAVPEPASMALMGVGALMLVARPRRRRAA